MYKLNALTVQPLIYGKEMPLNKTDEYMLEGKTDKWVLVNETAEWEWGWQMKQKLVEETAEWVLVEETAEWVLHCKNGFVIMTKNTAKVMQSI